MITIHLYGLYRRQFGKKFRLAVNTFTQAIRLPEANFPGKFASQMEHDEFYVARGRKIGQHMNLNTPEMLALTAPFDFTFT